MRVIGLFRELVWPKNDQLPSILPLRNCLAEDMVLPVLNYFSMGTGIIDFMEATRDPFDPARYNSGGPSLTTDGEFIWRRDLEDYVRLYRLGLPEEFLSRVKRVEIESFRGIWVKEIADKVLETLRFAEEGDPQALLY